MNSIGKYSKSEVPPHSVDVCVQRGGGTDAVRVPPGALAARTTSRARCRAICRRRVPERGAAGLYSFICSIKVSIKVFRKFNWPLIRPS